MTERFITADKNTGQDKENTNYPIYILIIFKFALQFLSFRQQNRIPKIFLQKPKPDNCSITSLTQTIV